MRSKKIITNPSKPLYEPVDPNNMFGNITGILLDTSESTKGKSGKNRIASPDLWEYTRLQGANVLNLVEDNNL